MRDVPGSYDRRRLGWVINSSHLFCNIVVRKGVERVWNIHSYLSKFICQSCSRKPSDCKEGATSTQKSKKR